MSGAARTDPALEDLQAEEHGVEEEELTGAAAGLARHHVHGAVLTERDARVHAPPLIPVLHHHHQPLQPHAPPRSILTLQIRGGPLICV